MDTRHKGKPPVIGVVGWKNSGKTTLVVRLVEELTRRGLRVSTVKHAHHDIAIDDEATDSARHRRAGAAEVAVVSPRRWAIVHEIVDEEPPTLEAIVARLEPADLVLVEGYKSAPIPKIEVRRAAGGPGGPLADGDASIMAIAADHAIEGARVPVLSLDDIAGVAELILERVRESRNV